jgi:cell division protein ZapA
MMSEKKRYVVQIYEQEYTLVSDETKEHVLQSVCLVDEMIRSIANKSSQLDIQKAAVLTAVRLASDFYNLQQELQAIEVRQETLVQHIAQELLT